jgi:hypothetical protein
VSTKNKRCVFVSSVQKGLEIERLAVKHTVDADPFLAAHCEAVLYELKSAAPAKAFEGALECLDSCQIYLLILGDQYGSLAGDLSITHHEYRRAKERKLPILAFIRGEQALTDGTALHRELKDDGFKYKRFQNNVELQKEVRSALVGLIEPLRRRRSLSAVLAFCLAVFLVGVLVLSVIPALLRRWNLQRLQAAQHHAQAIEMELRRLHPKVQATYQGEITYRDGANAKLAEDRWSDGRLEWRTLFSEGRLVARDKFLYRDGRLVGKQRLYVDDDTKRIFLVDEFASDGVLIGKRACPEGLERPCDDYLDVMRSPLPPLGQMFFYR